jgi:hypothetical protein
VIDPLTALILFGGSAVSAIGAAQAASQKSAAAKKQAETQQEMSEEQLQFQREGAVLGMEAGLEEQRRRQQEAAFRAGKLEDVVGLFEGLQGPQFQAVSPMGIQAQQIATPAAISAERVGAETLGESVDVGAMRDIAQQLAAQDSGVDLRRAAMRELDVGGESLNAMLAAQGVRGSGFGAMQARGMAGDVMAGLARDISQQRMQALTGAANIYQGAGGLSTQREMANQDALLRAALANQQAGLSADIATGEMGMQTALANQSAMLDAARANQVAELQAAGMNMEQAQAVADFNMQRTMQMGNIYQDEAFGANAPLDLSRSENLLQEYRRRWNVPGGNYGDGEQQSGTTLKDTLMRMPGVKDNFFNSIGANRPPPPAPEPKKTTSRALENPVTPAVEPRREAARSASSAAREREDTAPTRSITRRNINETPTPAPRSSTRTPPPPPPAPRSSTRTPPPPPPTSNRTTSSSGRFTAAVQPRTANTFISLDGKKTTTDSSKKLTSGTSSSTSKPRTTTSRSITKPRTTTSRSITTGTQGGSGTTTWRSTTSRATTKGTQGGSTWTTSATGASLTPGPSTKKVTSAPSKTTSTNKRFFTRGR